MLGGGGNRNLAELHRRGSAGSIVPPPLNIEGANGSPCE